MRRLTVGMVRSTVLGLLCVIGPLAKYSHAESITMSFNATATANSHSHWLAKPDKYATDTRQGIYPDIVFASAMSQVGDPDFGMGQRTTVESTIQGIEDQQGMWIKSLHEITSHNAYPGNSTGDSHSQLEGMLSGVTETSILAVNAETELGGSVSSSWSFTIFSTNPSNPVNTTITPNNTSASLTVLAEQTLNISLNHDSTWGWSQFLSGSPDNLRFLLVVTPIPEPSTLALLGIGAMSLLFYAWRRRRLTAIVMGLLSVVGVAEHTMAVAQGQTFNVLHSFSGSDGAQPVSGLTLYGSTLYGTAQSGGSDGFGTIFKIDTSGSGFSVLHSFSPFSITGDGATPYGGLAISGSTLYGVTWTGNGGGANAGTVFKINGDGSAYNVLYAFGVDTSSDIAYSPVTTPTIIGSTLYGTTIYGGSGGCGTIFKVGTDGNGFGVPHPFTGGSSDGASPWSGLIAGGSTLYGMTNGGGNSNLGTIFRVETNGSDFTILHSFGGGGTDGQYPWSNLTLIGSTLYGTTYQGGSSDDGIIFKINTDGSDYSVLHSFNRTSGDGFFPMSALTYIGSTLYGTTQAGGSSNNGTLFQIGMDGDDYGILHSFNGDDGSAGYNQYSGLTVIGSTLYGTTISGGNSNQGVIFSLTVPEPSAIVLLGIGAASLLAYAWRQRRRTA